MTDANITNNADHLQENFDDFFEMSLAGFIIADTEGMIIRANAKFANWIGSSPDELKGKRFSDLLSIGGRIYYETHLWPLLRMQGFFDEILLELYSSNGNKLRVLIHAYERRNSDGKPYFIRYTILKASDRLQYEQNLQEAKKTVEKELITQMELVSLREQLIAVLGHDLRNPLSAIVMSIELLAQSTSDDDAVLLATLKQSSSRMAELVNNIMDFARTRLGQSIVLKRQDVLLQPVLQQVVDELKLIYPTREIISSIEITKPVNCDPYRIAQLVSNLLANAFTHGAVNSPVYLHAIQENNNLKISVTNSGIPIPANLQEVIFTPYTRDASHASQNGLGLGLYISSEIAKAHNATLSFVSNEKGTCFFLNL